MSIPHVLTMLTVLPVAAAAIALFAGKHARLVALVATLTCLSLAVYIWMHLPAGGGMGMMETAAWAPSIGIEYHLGVDGLGALMLVLSAIVTLMSVDAAHRVHHQPGLYFALVLLLESGLFGTFTALNFFPLVYFLGTEPDPRVLPYQALGGTKRGPAATQFFVYTMVGSVALLVSMLAIYLATGAWTSST